MSQGPLPIEYSEVSRSGGATAEAGMLPYLDLIEAAGLRQSMRRRVGLREQGQSWTDDQLLTGRSAAEPRWGRLSRRSAGAGG